MRTATILALAPLALSVFMSKAQASAAGISCREYNAQTATSARHMNRELLLANGRLTAGDLTAGRNPKLDGYMMLFHPSVQAYGLQGRGQPADFAEVRAHYALVMGTPSPDQPDPGSQLREDLHVVAGPMAAHRYKAAIRVPGFPPDFGYFDVNTPLRLRGQTVFDFSGPNGTIVKRWSNHDNKFRTGQIWRHMLDNPRAESSVGWRLDLKRGAELPGGMIDRDGDRLNAAFNGEIAIGPHDFTLREGVFYYSSPNNPSKLSGSITEAEGVQYVNRFISAMTPQSAMGISLAWMTDDAVLHGADCDKQESADNASAIGGEPTAPGAAKRALASLLDTRLGSQFKARLLQTAVSGSPFETQPISAWSHVGFHLEWTGFGGQTWCSQWILRLAADSNSEVQLRAKEVWLDMKPLDPAARSCEAQFSREHHAARTEECRARPGLCN
jgi:hypothetical protein